MGDMNSEPSMEEILASIKKIIAEDGDKVAPKSRRSPVREVRTEERDAQPFQMDEDDVALDHAEMKVAESPPAHDEDDEVLELTDSVAEAQPMEEKPTISLVSSNTEAVSRSALASLSALVVKPDVHGSDTLEGVVREMLKPMLKEWLDAKLPDLVEAMVAKEIARISGRSL